MEDRGQDVPEGVSRCLWNAADSLTFTPIDGGTAYEVSKGTTGPEADLYIPAFYKGVPVVGIGYSAFDCCTTLQSVRIPSSITRIGAYGFYGCSSLQTISIPASVSSIPYTAFFYCTSLSSIQVDSRNEYYTSIDGVLFDESVSTLFCYPAARPDSIYAVPAGVATLGDFAFLNSIHLTEVTLPASVTAIKYCAFQGCGAMTGIFISLNVVTAEQFAFISCWSLSIRCQAGSKPTGWDAEWNYSSRPVAWGCSS